MIRYCTNCKSEYDYPVKSMKDMNNLICPNCNSRVAANSTKPVSADAMEKPAGMAGAFFGGLLHVIYVFLLVCGCIGIIAYFAGWNKLLYGIALISLIFGVSYYGPIGGMILILICAAGAGISFSFLRTLPGTCLGIMIGLVIWHLAKGMFYSGILKLARMGGKKQVGTIKEPSVNDEYIEPDVVTNYDDRDCL